jgi:hypothetical protein
MALVPDGLPVLSRGRHKSPARGACFMEYTALLAGEPFTDSPACTDQQLAAVLRHANDKLADADRPRLLPLLGRAIGLVVPGRPAAAARRRWGRPLLAADPATRLHARLTEELHRAVCDRFASAVGYVPSAVELRLHGHGGDVDRLFWHLMREPTVLATSADWVDRLVARLELLHDCYESALLELELAEADLRPAGEPEVGTV